MLFGETGGPGEEEKEGSVMVEFDDGDRGRISLVNIRLLPPGYQIRCEYGFVKSDWRKTALCRRKKKRIWLIINK